MEVPFELKALDDESGVFEGYASVFNNVDKGGDVVEPGAFKRTLDHSKGAIPILWFHDAMQPVGIGLEATEDDRGLLVKGQLDLGTQKGREVYSGLKMGYIKAMSIGYTAIVKEMKDGIRHLMEVALPEYSLLTKGFAMNPDADVTAVKSAPWADTAFELSDVAELLTFCSGEADTKEYDPEDVEAAKSAALLFVDALTPDDPGTEDPVPTIDAEAATKMLQSADLALAALV